MEVTSGRDTSDFNGAEFFRPWDGETVSDLSTTSNHSTIDESTNAEQIKNRGKQGESDEEDTDSVDSSSSASSVCNRHESEDFYGAFKRVYTPRRILVSSCSCESCDKSCPIRSNTYPDWTNNGNNNREIGSSEVDTYCTGDSNSSGGISSMASQSTFESVSPALVHPHFNHLPPYIHSIHPFVPYCYSDQINRLHGLASMSVGSYGHCMEEAVKHIYQQDIAAKQQKKLRPKKFRCLHCDVAFSNNGQLKGHIRIHTGERPFKCEVDGCNKAFTRNEELTRHKKIHTGLKPHCCEVCGKSFGRKDHLKKHQRTHQNRGIPGHFNGTMFGFIEPPPYHSLPSGRFVPPYHYPVCT